MKLSLSSLAVLAIGAAASDATCSTGYCPSSLNQTFLASKPTDSNPVADCAEINAFFPSTYSLTQYTSTISDWDNSTYSNAYKGGKWKILMIATQERYLTMAGGEYFSTGNHPVEMFVPLLHLNAAGFEVDIATVGGQPVKLETWAFPTEDKAVQGVFAKYEAALRAPLALDDVWGTGFTSSTPYIGVFIPGGHGAMNGAPTSLTVGKILRWANSYTRYLISICHGPAAMLAANIGKPAGSEFIYKNYTINSFPNSLDTGLNIQLGYIPGKMKWLVSEALTAAGVNVLNTTGFTGAVHQDRYVLTGDSPIAANSLGKLAASVLIKDVATRK